MGRRKIDNRATSVSVSLPSNQVEFLDHHPNFNLSKFTQIHLGDYIELTKQLEDAIKEVEKTNEKTIE